MCSGNCFKCEFDDCIATEKEIMDFEKKNPAVVVSQKEIQTEKKRHTSENTRRNTMQNTKQKSLQGIGNGIWKRLIIFARSTMKNTKNTTNNTGMKSCRKRKRQEHGRKKNVHQKSDRR